MQNSTELPQVTSHETDNRNELLIFGPSDGVQYLSISMWILTIVIGVPGNTLLSFTIGYTASLQTAMNTYVMGIALIDLLTCSILVPLRMVLRWHISTSAVFMTVLFGSELFARTFTEICRLFLMQALSIERYQSIAKPFSVTKAQARKRALIISGCIWLFCMGLSVVSVRFFCDSVLYEPCINQEADDMVEWGALESFVEMPLSLLSVMAIVVSYGLMFMVLRKQRKRMNKHDTKPKKKKKTNKVAPIEKEKVAPDSGPSAVKITIIDESKTDKPEVMDNGKGDNHNKTSASGETTVDTAAISQESGNCGNDVVNAKDSDGMKDENIEKNKEGKVGQSGKRDGEQKNCEGNMTEETVNSEAKTRDDAVAFSIDSSEHRTITHCGDIDPVEPGVSDTEVSPKDSSLNLHENVTSTTLTSTSTCMSATTLSSNSAAADSTCDIAPGRQFANATDLPNTQGSLVTSQKNSLESNDIAKELPLRTLGSPSDESIDLTKGSRPSSSSLIPILYRTSSRFSKARRSLGNFTKRFKFRSSSIPSRASPSSNSVESNDGNKDKELSVSDSFEEILKQHPLFRPKTKEDNPLSNDCKIDKPHKVHFSLAETKPQETASVNNELFHPVEFVGANKDSHLNADTDKIEVSNKHIIKVRIENHDGPGNNNVNGSISRRRSDVKKDSLTVPSVHFPERATKSSNTTIESVKKSATNETSNQAAAVQTAESANNDPSTLIAADGSIVNPDAANDSKNSGQNGTDTAQTSSSEPPNQTETVKAVRPAEREVEIVEMDGTVHKQSITNESAAAPIEGAVCLMNPKNREQGKRRVEMKAALKVGLLFCCFVCLWMPLPISVLVMRGTASWQDPVKVDILTLFSALATSTAAVDPILYGLFNHQIRNASIAGVKKFKRKIINYFRHG